MVTASSPAWSDAGQFVPVSGAARSSCPVTRPAFFGPPVAGAVNGGTLVTVYLVPVFEAALVAFDVRAEEARGRWLPWKVLDFGGNPYIAASELLDDWCDGAVEDLSLADVMSLETAGGGWELAIVFRAELTARPAPQGGRVPCSFQPGRIDAIGAFDPVDLERWIAARPPGAGAAPGLSREPGLLF